MVVPILWEVMGRERAVRPGYCQSVAPRRARGLGASGGEGEGERMTLQEWSDKTGVLVKTHESGAKVIPQVCIPDEEHWRLWKLTDYAVSSVTGGSVWLVKRERVTTKPKCRVGYECGICSCYHPAAWDGDCREDA